MNRRNLLTYTIAVLTGIFSGFKFKNKLNKLPSEQPRWDIISRAVQILKQQNNIDIMPRDWNVKQLTILAKIVMARNS